jgi:serine/threonine protein kinase
MYVTTIKPRKINHLRESILVNFLGEGTHGTIELYQCKQISNTGVCNKLFVVKRIKCKREKEKREDFYKEYEIGMMLDHPNIRRTLDIDINFENIILEMCDGIDLLDYLDEYNDSNVKDLVELFGQLIDAVDYLHTKNIVHLDIKLENIMINPKNKIIKLIDLGQAMLVKENELIYGRKGTVQYMAPEVIYLYDFDPKLADLWCCGIVLYNLYYNRMPWNFAKLDDIHYKNHFNSIKDGMLIDYMFPINTNYDEMNEKIIKKLLFMMLNVYPEKRKNSSMIKNFYSLLLKGSYR